MIKVLNFGPNKVPILPQGPKNFAEGSVEAILCNVYFWDYKDPVSSLQISVKICYQGTKPNGRLRRSTGIPIHCEYQPNQISEPCNQGPI